MPIYNRKEEEGEKGRAHANAGQHRSAHAGVGEDDEL
jgi:hypothetical protein